VKGLDEKDGMYTESLEMVNENNVWLIVEFKILPCKTFYFFDEGIRWKRWKVKQSLWKW
jgi:hypothetical protein